MCAAIEQLVAARPPKKLKAGHTSPNDHRLEILQLKTT